MIRIISREQWKNLGIAAILRNPVPGIGHSGQVVLSRESWVSWIVRKIGETIKS